MVTNLTAETFATNVKAVTIVSNVTVVTEQRQQMYNSSICILYGKDIAS